VLVEFIAHPFRWAFVIHD